MDFSVKPLGEHRYEIWTKKTTRKVVSTLCGRQRLRLSSPFAISKETELRKDFDPSAYLCRLN